MATNFYDDIDQFDPKTALITESSDRVSYSELVKAADSLKSHFDRKCLAFCVCQNNVESVVGYLGFLRARVVPVLINEGIDAELFNDLLQLYKPEYVWLPDEKSHLLQAATEITRYKRFVLFKTSFVVDYTLHPELALLLTTSGSTGSPKLVRQSYKNIDSNASSIARYLEIKSEDRPITTLPMSYTYGLSIINSHLLKGAAVILTNRTLMDKSFWELFKKEQASTFGGVPYIYEMLKKLRFSSMQLPSLKYLTQAGGKLNKDLVQEFVTSCESKGIRFFVMYGQTEATARMSYLPSQYAKTKSASMGIAIPGGEFWLEDDQGNIMTENEVVGELVYRGNNVTMGYALNCHDLSRGYDNGDILRTGDMAKRDQEGFYYIVGRKKRFLKLFGNRVNLDEVEQLLRRVGHDCACAGEDDQMRIYTTELHHCECIRHFVTDRMGIHMAGFEVVHIENIPRNESGKILYLALK